MFLHRWNTIFMTNIVHMKHHTSFLFSRPIPNTPSIIECFVFSENLGKNSVSIPKSNCHFLAEVILLGQRNWKNFTDILPRMSEFISDQNLFTFNRISRAVCFKYLSAICSLEILIECHIHMICVTTRKRSSFWCAPRFPTPFSHTDSRFRDPIVFGWIRVWK